MKKLYGLFAVVLTLVLVTGCATSVTVPQGDSVASSTTATVQSNEKQEESTNAAQATTTQSPAVTTQTTEPSAVDNTKRITSEEAKNIALAAVGVAESDISALKVELDYDDDARRWEYEVDFRVGKIEYDIDVDAESGKILRNESDREPTATTTQSSDLITRERAKSLALERAEVTEAQISDYEIELDYDDDARRWEYEISFDVGRTEYECEINAENGSIIYLNKEVDD